MSASRFRDFSRAIHRESIEAFLRKNAFIMAVIISAIVIYTFYFSAETITNDGSDYMLLGMHITEGRYTETFLHRLPVLPVTFAALQALSGTAGARYAIPLAFIIISLVLSYKLFRELSDENTARLSVLVLMCFPQFWRWGAKFLTDIPMMAFSLAFIILFERSLVDRRMFIPAGVIAALGLLTKISFAIVPIAIITYTLLFRRKNMISKDIIIGGALCVSIFAAAFLSVSMLRSADDLMLISHMVDSTVTGSRLSGLMQVLTGEYGDVAYFSKLAMFPMLFFLPFGALSLWKKNKLPVFFTAFTFILMFSLWVVRLRYYSPIFPFVAMMCAAGFLYLRDRCKGNLSRLVTLAFVVLLFLSFSNSLYMLSLDTTMLWGAESLSRGLAPLDGLIATEYSPHYINLTSDVLSDEDASGKIFFSGGLDRAALEENGVDYIVLSVYGEFARDPSDDSYLMMYGPFQTPIKRPYTGERVPPDFTFRSELFRDIQASSWLQPVGNIENPNGQTVFMIYRVL